MANTNIKDSIYEAIDVIVGKRIEDLHLDKTIKCNIVKCLNPEIRRYKISYMNGETIAYAKDDTDYLPNTEVYVTVPQGNFSNKKWIVGRTHEQIVTQQNVLIDGANQYSTLGTNIIDNKDIFTLTSSLGNITQVLYDVDNAENLINIDTSVIKIYQKDAQGIRFSAHFSSALLYSQPKSKNISGDFGIVFTLAFKNLNATYSTMQEQWNALEPKTQINGQRLQYFADTITAANFEQMFVKFMLFKIECRLYKDEQINTLLQNYFDFLNNIYQTKDYSNLNEQYQEWLQGPGTVYQENNVVFYLNTSKMVGDYYRFSNSYQFLIANIDMEQFVRIEKIVFYASGWIEDQAKQSLYLNDVQINDIDITFLKTNNNYNSDYQLVLDTPKGIVFGAAENAVEELSVAAKLIYSNLDVTNDGANILWFKKNNQITVNSANYNVFAGSGWEQLGKESFNSLVLYRNQNINYENVYKVVGLWQNNVVATLEFVIYNQLYTHNVEIISESGTKYGWGQSVKKLICVVDGEQDIIENYTYKWYQNLDDIITLLSSNNNTIDFSNTDFIGDKITIECQVYDDNNQEIGIGSIILTNNINTIIQNNQIEIINGNQVFQYNELGVAPTSKQYENPLVPRSLTCNFYDMNGGLIDPLNYEIYWEYPLVNTLINSDDLDLVWNESKQEYNLLIANEAPIAIKDDFNYHFTNNQILCYVKFQDNTYVQETNFYFGKVGDAGTNGTDIIARISPIYPLTDSILTMSIRDGEIEWNSIQDEDNNILQCELYQRNSLLDISTNYIQWTIAKNGKIFNVIDNHEYAEITYLNNQPVDGLTNQIIKCQIIANEQAYYGYYPIPLIIYENECDISLSIDKQTTLRQIVYNSDGRSPKYNTNQGVGLRISNITDLSFTSAARGGANENTDASFTLGTETIDLDNNIYFVPIIANNIYNGEYLNQHVKIEVEKNNNLIATVYVPIHMLLNTYGLASLNGWDGNSIEVNETGEYILAPQVGAGKKEEDNSFTGVIIGTAKTYDEEKIGLLGYSRGERSIFLDAETGQAIFGIPEKNGDTSKGIIQLNPIGTSSISSWSFDARSLYSSKDGLVKPAYEDAPSGAHGSIPHNNQGILLSASPAYASFKGKPFTEDDPILYSDPETTIRPGDTFELQIDPNNFNFFELFEHSCGRPREGTGDLVFDSNTIIQDGRELSVLQGNTWILKAPLTNTDSEYAIAVKASENSSVWLFRIIDNNQPIELNDTLTDFKDVTINDHVIWRRYPKVGIDSTGHFFVEKVTTEDASFFTGKFTAFGASCIGPRFSIKNTNKTNNDSTIFKIFVRQNGSYDDPVFFSSSRDNSTEGARPIRIYGQANNNWSSGIFIGTNNNSTTPNYINKLEFTNQNSKYGINLFTNAGANYYSQLHLEAQSDNNTVTGFLKHSGNWITEISNQLTIKANNIMVTPLMTDNIATLTVNGNVQTDNLTTGDITSTSLTTTGIVSAGSLTVSGQSVVLTPTAINWPILPSVTAADSDWENWWSDTKLAIENALNMITANE